jgi:AraC-like DNA-binding protein
MLALDGCRVFRPWGTDGAVEIAHAEPADRVFPLRTARSLGVCLKRGPAHEVAADGRALRYPADAICVRAPGCVWACESTGPAAFHSIDIDERLLPEGLGAAPMTFLPERSLPQLSAALRALEHSGSGLEREQALAELLMALRGTIRADALEHDAGLAAVERARALLVSELGVLPSLDELSQAAGANKFVLLRRFKRTFGITPHAYAVAVRLDRARELLARGVHAADVAARLGFSDQAHFTRSFRRSVGLTPVRYARQVRRLVGVPAETREPARSERST